ncbi:MAG TPA: 50S ribosomal protein L17 [Chloroflexota bacterium]|jgi:large subunit ribosomal protein L17|nr:50S ribosomal protein L17 [Chloroflexota bacterium]
MRHRMIGRKLNRPPAERLRLLRSLMGALIRYERITTTEARAKELRRHIERLITTARRGDVHSRRLALARLPDPPAVAKLFHVVAPRYANRPGGYTRLTRVGLRKGDGAQLVQIELLDRDTPAEAASA